MGKVAVGAVDCFSQLALGEFGGEQAVLAEEDIVAVHEVVEVVADDGDSAVVQQDAPPVLLEGFYTSHVHRVLIVAEVESAAGRGGGALQRALLGVAHCPLGRRFLRRRSVHFIVKINKKQDDKGGNHWLTYRV